MEHPARAGGMRGFLQLALPYILSRSLLNDENVVTELTRGFPGKASLIPRARFHLLQGPLASHCAILEMPEGFFALTTSFADGVKQ